MYKKLKKLNLPHRFVRGDVKFSHYGKTIHYEILEEMTQVRESPWQGVEQESHTIVVIHWIWYIIW